MDDSYKLANDVESEHDFESNSDWDIGAAQEPESDAESFEEPDSDAEDAKSQNPILLQAAVNGDEDLLQRLLDDGANLGGRNSDGQTCLHLAVLYNQESMVRLLLKKGANIETICTDGSKPLHIAAQIGNLKLVELLLQFRADVESWNLKTKTTALYESVSKEHLDVAKFLLDHGADVDAKGPRGYTPLFIAVSLRDLPLVEMLLQHGASKTALLQDGRTVEDLASGDNAMRDRLLLDLLHDDQVLDGPSINGTKKVKERRFVYIQPPPADKIDKLNACDGFKCTIVDFFLGDREQRIQVSTSIYDLWYGRGPNTIMEAAQAGKMLDKERAFRWYHLPANNMEWVEGLVTRIFAQRGSGAAMFDEELKSELGLTNVAGRQFRASTAHSSFMRPLCQTVKPHPNSSLGKSQVEPIIAFVCSRLTHFHIPFLHFETFRDYEEMSRIIAEVKVRIARERAILDPVRSSRPTRRTKNKPRKGTPSPPSKARTPSDATSSVLETDDGTGLKGIFHRAQKLRSAVQTLPSRVKKSGGRLFKSKATPEPQIDLEKGTGETEFDGDRSSKTMPPLSDNKATEKENGLSKNTKKEINITKEDELPEEPDNPGLEASIEDKTTTHVGEAATSAAEGQPAIKEAPLGPKWDKHMELAGMYIQAARLKAKNATESADSAEPQIPEPDPVASTNAEQVRAASSTRVRRISFENAIDNSTNRDNLGDNLVDPSVITADGQHESANAPTRNARRSQSTDRARDADGVSSKGSSRMPRPVVGNLNEHLIKGYLHPSKRGEIPPLQIRRTLDQYFYTHLTSTAQRDTDQVVWRHTQAAGMKPKIFMVDQLWLWVLDEDTVISCCPERWQPWSVEAESSTRRKQSLAPGPQKRHADRPLPPPSALRGAPPSPLGQRVAPPPPRHREWSNPPNQRSAITAPSPQFSRPAVSGPPPPPGLHSQPGTIQSSPGRPLKGDTNDEASHQPPVLVENTTPLIEEDEAECRKRLTTYAAYLMRKAPPLDPENEFPTWARAEIIEERLSQNEILKRIRRLNESSRRTMVMKKSALAPFQQGQVSRLLDDLQSAERDAPFEWALAQFDSVQKPIKSLDPDSNQKLYETTTMTTYMKRAPMKDVDVVALWKSHEGTRAERVLPPVIEDPLDDLAHHEPDSQHPGKSKSSTKRTGGILEWMAGIKTTPSSADYGPTRLSTLDPADKRIPTDGVKKRPVVLEDPLDVRHRILKHLRGSARAPITSVYDMASLITDSCANIFDPYRIPDEYQFFDFFESSIGNLLDKEAKCYTDFMDLSSHVKPGGDDMKAEDVLNIEQEIKYLVEVRDIRDELSILQLVLNDQQNMMEELGSLIEKNMDVDQSGKKRVSAIPRRKNKVLESHLHRIEKMDTLTKNTYKGFNHLLDLKQKQANVSEAYSARLLAKNTFKQTEISKELAEESLNQARETARQADETARQGKTVLLFTVVTIIFLPLSFMAAFFAISIDRYPVNENGKLSLSYVLKYMFSISGAISIPFIFVAFNQDRITGWMKNRGRQTFVWAVIFIVLTVFLAVIWTGNLASGIKAAITVSLILVALLGGAGYGLSRLMEIVRA